MYKQNDLSGMRFGKLTVMKENGRSKDRHITWDCTIDRIDPCGNYEPANCRWVDMCTQNRNKRSNARGEEDA